MRHAVLSLALLGLAACGRERAEAPDAVPAAEPPAEAAAAKTLSPEALFFVGRWAADEEMCADPWIITAQELRTPGHVVCRLERIARTEAGAEAQATCTAEEPLGSRRHAGGL